MKRTQLLGLILVLELAAGAVRAQLPKESVTLRSFDGRSMQGEIGHLSVPAVRSSATRKFEVAFYRFQTQHSGNEVPIIFLMGGPGISATFIAQVPPYFTLFRSLAEQAPVILLDQRGTGLSKPTVDCPEGFNPPANLFTTPHALLKTYVSSYAKCSEYWSSRGVFPDDFSVEEVADDVEDIRAALGVPKVDLLALSFGTRIALEVVRRHPQGVRRMLLQGTVTPDGLVRLPFEMDKFFRQTAEESKSQASAKGLDPDLVAAFSKARSELQRRPLAISIHAVSGSEITVTIGADTFAALVATRTTDPRLPALLTSLARGDKSVLAPILQSIYQDLEKGAGSLMAHSIACTATDSKLRLRIAKSEAPKSLLGEPFDNSTVSEGFCRQIHAGRFSKGTPAPTGEIPVLFITGDLDDRTPAQLVENARKGFTQSRVLLVRNGGHELLPELGVQKLVQDFFAGKDGGELNISLPPREFSTITEAAHPPSHPK
jgi:pimeloyl-ACP methyl ester carboxylesterase